MEKKKKFIVDVVFAGVILLIILLICKYILPVLIPFIIAFVIASILQIPVNRICRNFQDKKRIISLIVIIAFFALAALGVAVAGIKIINGVAGFLVAVPSIYQDDIMPALDFVFYRITEMIETSDVAIAEKLDDAFNDFLNNIGNYITDFSMKAVGFVSGGIVGIPEFIIKLIITIISSVFFMIDYDMIMNFFTKFILEGKKEIVNKFKEYIKNTLMVYLKSYTLLFLLTYAELSIGFQLIGIPYAPIVGLAVAIFDILPVLGTGGILLPWAVILLVMRNIPMAIGILVLYLVITIIRNTVEPKIVGKQIGLHPLATLISMYLGLNILGFLGMFIFPVSLAVLLNMKRNTTDEQINAIGE
ncbi:MAG: sporulation integral membrane protein YtvI [Lachnospiraceae bacterium]|nr:sporulation integral membrane protein YtvI [Lachnospiraceae bacterium]